MDFYNPAPRLDLLDLYRQRAQAPGLRLNERQLLGQQGQQMMLQGLRPPGPEAPRLGLPVPQSPSIPGMETAEPPALRFLPTAGDPGGLIREWAARQQQAAAAAAPPPPPPQSPTIAGGAPTGAPGFLPPSVLTRNDVLGLDRPLSRDEAGLLLGQPLPQAGGPAGPAPEIRNGPPGAMTRAQLVAQPEALTREQAQFLINNPGQPPAGGRVGSSADVGQRPAWMTDAWLQRLQGGQPAAAGAPGNQSAAAAGPASSSLLDMARDGMLPNVVPMTALGMGTMGGRENAAPPSIVEPGMSREALINQTAPLTREQADFLLSNRGAAPQGAADSLRTGFHPTQGMSLQGLSDWLDQGAGGADPVTGVSYAPNGNVAHMSFGQGQNDRLQALQGFLGMNQAGNQNLGAVGQALQQSALYGPGGLMQQDRNLDSARVFGAGGVPGSLAVNAQNALNSARENDQRYGPSARYDALYAQQLQSMQQQGMSLRDASQILREQGMAPPPFVTQGQAAPGTTVPAGASPFLSAFSPAGSAPPGAAPAPPGAAGAPAGGALGQPGGTASALADALSMARRQYGVVPPGAPAGALAQLPAGNNPENRERLVSSIATVMNRAAQHGLIQRDPRGVFDFLGSNFPGQALDQWSGMTTYPWGDAALPWNVSPDSDQRVASLDAYQQLLQQLAPEQAGLSRGTARGFGLMGAAGGFALGGTPGAAAGGAGGAGLGAALNRLLPAPSAPGRLW